MRTITYISKKIGSITNLLLGRKVNTTTNFELTNRKIGFNLKERNKTSGSLLSLLYSEENEALFI